MPRGESLIRQWNLLKALQTHHYGLGTDELAERLECSKRQVLRDLAVLGQVGFPVRHASRDRGKRFWTLGCQFIEREGLMLTVTEMVSLFLSQQLLAPLGGTELGRGLATALEKIKALLPRKALSYFRELDGRLLVKSVGFHDYSGQAEEIRLLNQATADGRVAMVRYQSPGKPRPQETPFRPYGLVFLEGNLYCIGLMESHGEVRTLKLDRILGVELTDQTFEYPDDFSLEEYTRGSFGIINSGTWQFVRARFTGWAATVVREKQWHFTQKILEDKGDSVVVQFELSSLTEFRRWILGFGGCAAVLEPSALCAEIREELTAMNRLYLPKE